MRWLVLFGLALGCAPWSVDGAAAQGRSADAAGAPLAARELPRGRVLTVDDIRPSAGASAKRGAAVGPGWVTRRVIAAGEPLRPPAVAPPEVVRVGQPVQVLWQRGAVQIRLRGEALNSAALGERVRVRVDLHRRFQGVAEGPGRVRLELEG